MHTRYAQYIYKELAHNESSCIQIQNQHPQHIWVVIKKLGTYTIRKLTSHHCHGAQYMLRIHTQDMHKICVQDLFIFVYYVYNFKGMIWKIRLFFSFFPCSDHGILRLKGVKILCESLWSSLVTFWCCHLWWLHKSHGMGSRDESLGVWFKM